MRMHDPGRHEPDHYFFITYNQGVTGIVAALTANDNICLRSKQICNLTFTLITPLRAEHDYIFRHL